MPKTLPAPSGHSEWLADRKARLARARLKASLAANRELVLRYRHIGCSKGCSPCNLKYMRAFAEAWPQEQFVQQVAAQLPWFHNCVYPTKPPMSAPHERARSTT